ncbi:MAG TPA: pyridoxamine 5'-phosphate oxidase family protein [Acidimicrobiia bacterium]|nr:pyridoxamine 5'-phosphate oxidase family protein [Acidimicrobiia bacterium]
MSALDWDTFVSAAAASSWVTYLGTVDSAGRPHVSVVAPGFTAGSVWFATRIGSKKYRNLRADPAAAFHWPVGNAAAPGEVIARGSALLYDSAEDRLRLWNSAVLPYDMSGSFGSPDNPDFGFVEVRVDEARLLGPDFVARRWLRSDRMG